MTNLAAALAAILVIIGGAYAYNNFEIKKVPEIKQESIADVLTKNNGADVGVTTSAEATSSNSQSKNSDSVDIRADMTAGVAQQFPQVQVAPKLVAQKGDAVLVDYVGQLNDGTVFDTSIGKKPFAFVLGQGRVIQGWDEGIIGMKVGEVKELVIPAQKAYGANEIKDPSTGKVIIPANATLYFKVHLVDLERE